jgi:hypothetical protein
MGTKVNFLYEIQNHHLYYPSFLFEASDFQHSPSPKKKAIRCKFKFKIAQLRREKNSESN